jgi:hypothetical protein
MLICVVGAVLGYGYWHAVTHASFNVTTHMVTGPGQKPQDMLLAKIDFLDAAGNKLAQGFSDEKYNFVHLLHPQVGDCHEIAQTSGTKAGRNAWQECFAQMSTWVPQWAEDVKMVDVTYQERLFEKIPVSVSSYNSDWLLWWVPLPHIGGKPYTYYRMRITVEAAE